MKKKTCFKTPPSQIKILSEISDREGIAIAGFLREALALGKPISKQKVPGPYGYKINISLTEEQFERLEKIAKQAGITKSEAVRRLLESQIERYLKEGE